MLVSTSKLRRTSLVAVGTICVEVGPLVDASSTLCSVTSDCCFNIGASECVAPGAGTCGIRFAGDGPEDCPEGNQCRGAGADTAGAPGFQERDRCHETVQCPNGHVCCPQKIVLEGGGYAEPPTSADDPEYVGFTNGVCLAIDGPLDAWRCDR